MQCLVLWDYSRKSVFESTSLDTLKFLIITICYLISLRVGNCSHWQGIYYTVEQGIKFKVLSY